MLLHDSLNMEQSVPENLSTHVFNCEKQLSSNNNNNNNNNHDSIVISEEHLSNSKSDLPAKELLGKSASPVSSTANMLNTSSSSSSTSSSCMSNGSTTKVKLSFSVDRLLSVERNESMSNLMPTLSSRHCCDGSVYACCTMPSCFGQTTEASKHSPATNPQALTNAQAYAYAGLDKFYPGLYMDNKSVLRPTPIRAAEHATTFPTFATNALLRFHQQQQQQLQQQQQQQQHLHPPHQLSQHKAAALLHGSSAAAAAALLAPLNSLKSLQLTQQQRFLAKATQQQQSHQQQHQLLDIPTTATGVASSAQNGAHMHSSNGNSNNAASSNSSSHNSSNNNTNNNNNGKRKRSWSRAVFTNLQRKGLEIQFQQQKYITKPDRRKLAARLNLTDAQVKVWFQNRRMKWRHTRENLKSGQEKQPQQQVGGGSSNASKTLMITAGVVAAPLDYSSDSCSSVALSDRAADDDNIEIDVVE